MSARKKKKKFNAERVIQRKIIPGLLTAFSLVVLVYLLHIFSIGLETGLGSSAVIFASFAASAFILFMVPHSNAARPSRFVKSYLIGAVLGYAGFLLSGIVGMYISILVIMFALALLLVFLDAVHPPGAGIAFAFLLYRVGLAGIFVVILGVAIMLLVRYFLERAVYTIEEDFTKAEKVAANRKRR
ncbi:MAG: HPP family protein [Candidatus Marsarchaeota archaeon]|jgi:CBS-domain-containing membrane protein|nr:HPP family protein [Candidatus Marsarchaeota archaeon]MCL5111330.1 HPP family protein [Candidatus Marsarchaeota archaeon]